MSSAPPRSLLHSKTASTPTVTSSNQFHHRQSVRFQEGEESASVEMNDQDQDRNQSPPPSSANQDGPIELSESSPLLGTKPSSSSSPDNSLCYFDTHEQQQHPNITIAIPKNAFSDEKDDDLSYGDNSNNSITFYNDSTSNTPKARTNTARTHVHRTRSRSTSLNDNDNDNDDHTLTSDGTILTREHRLDEAEERAALLKLRSQDSPFYNDKRPVLYDDNSHFRIMTQMHGSVWLYVLPYCLLNVLWTYVISYLKTERGVDLTIPASGHKFMVVLVSFLVVSRVQITYSRFMEARTYLGGCFRMSRELMHSVSVFTMPSRNEGAKKWRRKVGEKILKLLRITIGAIEFTSRRESPWDALNDYQKGTELKTMVEFVHNHIRENRTEEDEALRAPILYATILRSELLSPRRSKCLDVPLVVPEELRLITCVNGFTTAYHGLHKLITTPFPFPLVQMTRTILFFWLYTLPLALMKDFEEAFEVMVIVAFITYGFLGLEYVSIELDDPFGQDPNDFNSLGMAQKVYEDVYLTLLTVDGPESAEKLRTHISKKVVEQEDEHEKFPFPMNV